jgi:hypothetical protein
VVLAHPTRWDSPPLQPPITRYSPFDAISNGLGPLLAVGYWSPQAKGER